MTRHEIRFKCLELCYRKDLAAEDSIKIARTLEAYVTEPEAGFDLKEKPLENKGRGRPPKSGSTNILG